LSGETATNYQYRTASLLDMAADWTIELWANTPSADQGELFSQSNSGTAIGTNRIHVYIWDGDYTCMAVNSAGTSLYVTAAGTYTDAWHHIACTWDVSETLMVLYVDGVERARRVAAFTGSQTFTTMALSQRVSSGGWAGGSTSTMQDVALYTSVLSATQINTHYSGASFWAGSTTAASANFYVTSGGFLKATNALIGGWAVGSSTIASANILLTSGGPNVANIAVGSGSYLAGLNSAVAGTDIAFWAGSTFANRATAPTRITAAGGFTATDATLTGSLTAGNLLLSSSTGLQITSTTSVDNRMVAFFDSTNQKAVMWYDTSAGWRMTMSGSHSVGHDLAMGGGGMTKASFYTNQDDNEAHYANFIFEHGLVIGRADLLPTDGDKGVGTINVKNGYYVNGQPVVSFSGNSFNGDSCSGGDKMTGVSASDGLISGITCGADPVTRELASLRALVADLQARLAALEAGRQR
jgi:hypothetical protein